MIRLRGYGQGKHPPVTSMRQESRQMAKSTTPRPQQGGANETPAQQEQTTPPAPQQGNPPIRDWASI